MKKTIVVATYYDEAFREIGGLSATSIVRYASKHGYDARIERQPRTERPASWNKIPLIQNLFREGYEFVFWIDADAVITDHEHDIRQLIKNSKDLYLVNVGYEGGVIPSMGIILIRNSPWSRAMLAAIWEKSEYTHHHLWENLALCDILGLVAPLSEDIVRCLPHAIRTKRPDPAYIEKIEWLPTAWNWVWPGTYAKDSPIIRHYPATPLYVRKYMMSRDMIMAGFLPIHQFIGVFLSTVITHMQKKAKAVYSSYAIRACGMMLNDLIRALSKRLFP